MWTQFRGSCARAGRCPLAARRALLVLLLACFRVLWSVKKVFHMKIYFHLPSLCELSTSMLRECDGRRDVRRHELLNCNEK